MKDMLPFALFVLMVVGFLFGISGKKYPQMPPDTSRMGVTDTVVCMGCHYADRVYPRKQHILPRLNA